MIGRSEGVVYAIRKGEVRGKRSVRGQFCSTALRELAECQVHLLVHHLAPQKHQLSSSEFAACWLLRAGLISLASNPVPVEEPPVARTTVAPSAAASNGALSICFTKTPAQWSGSRAALLEGPAFCTKDDLFSFDDSINSYRCSSAFIPRATLLLVNS